MILFDNNGRLHQTLLSLQTLAARAVATVGRGVHTLPPGLKTLVNNATFGDSALFSVAPSATTVHDSEFPKPGSFTESYVGVRVKFRIGELIAGWSQELATQRQNGNIEISSKDLSDCVVIFITCYETNDRHRRLLQHLEQVCHKIQTQPTPIREVPTRRDLILDHVNTLSEKLDIAFTMYEKFVGVETDIVLDHHLVDCRLRISNASTVECLNKMDHLTTLHLTDIFSKLSGFGRKMRRLDFLPRLRHLVCMNIRSIHTEDLIHFLTGEVEIDGHRVLRENVLQDITLIRLPKVILQQLYDHPAISDDMKSRIFSDVDSHYESAVFALMWGRFFVDFDKLSCSRPFYNRNTEPLYLLVLFQLEITNVDICHITMNCLCNLMCNTTILTNYPRFVQAAISVKVLKLFQEVVDSSRPIMISYNILVDIYFGLEKLNLLPTNHAEIIGLPNYNLMKVHLQSTSWRPSWKWLQHS